MKFGKLIEGSFEKRINRFLALVRVDKGLCYAHVANSGRLRGLFLEPGCRIWLREVIQEKRKTKFDVVLVEKDGVLVSIDARIPNQLIYEALLTNQITDQKYAEIRREVKLGKSRIDFCLMNLDDIIWIETKSVTHVAEGIALFPDAPTERGKKHLIELSKCILRGNQAAVFFLVQRIDAHRFTPNFEVDPDFSRTLTEVSKLGVEVRSFTCQVGLDGITIADEIDCTLTPKSGFFHL
jgi:sugar fermentation stimulation protein A